jgi:F-type H+-transporting ATPase subunit gamma
MSSEHLLRERAELLDELHDIVQVMKNVAFAELQRVNRELPTLSEARDTVLDALSQLPDVASDVMTKRHPAADRDSAAAWLVIGAERGFCGAFNARLSNELESLRRAAPRAPVLVASRRLCDLLGTGVAGAIALPGCAAVEDSAGVIDAWLDAIAPFTAPASGEVWLMRNSARGVLRSRLWPIAPVSRASMAAETRACRAHLPLHHLPWPTLRDALLRQALRLLLQVALHESLAQENHWRLSQMQLAQDHLDDLGCALQRKRAALHQAQITNELETLLSALPAGSSITRTAPAASDIQRR